MTQVRPPPGWDADEATERILVECHARPEHQARIAAALSANPPEPHPCFRCRDAAGSLSIDQDLLAKVRMGQLAEEDDAWYGNL